MMAGRAAHIASYMRERRLLFRLVRRYQPLSAERFDQLFYRHSFMGDKPRCRWPRMDGDSFILGGMGGTDTRDWWLDLLQHQMALGGIETVRINGDLHYRTDGKFVE